MNSSDPFGRTFLLTQPVVAGPFLLKRRPGCTPYESEVLIKPLSLTQALGLLLFALENESFIIAALTPDPGPIFSSPSSLPPISFPPSISLS